MSHLEAIVIACRDPVILSTFWSRLLGLPIDPGDVEAIESNTLAAGESVLLGPREGFHVWLTPSEDPQHVPGRVHLDVRLDSDGELAEVLLLGATHQWDDPEGRWAVLADPEGNVFCAVHPHPSGA